MSQSAERLICRIEEAPMKNDVWIALSDCIR